MSGRFVNSDSFWLPHYLETSAWLEHAPFAFWLTSVVRPSVIVELGTHSGFSYFAFCQAVKQLGLATRCYAIDTWQGDEHSGAYGEEIYGQVSRYNEDNYSTFSKLVRSSFDEALPGFTDETIDVLHIDGRHFYEDVAHDYERWKPKLSDRSVVLFHDTNVRTREFGVWKLWQEISGTLPSFEFVHGHGLGVLANTECISGELGDLLRLSDPAGAADVRYSYSRLGRAIANFSYAQELQRDKKCRELQIEALLRAHEARAKVYQRALQYSEATVRRANNQIDNMRKSKSWRITKPLRAISPFSS